MRVRTSILLIAAAFSLYSCSRGKLSDKLDELDSVLEEKENYQLLFERSMAKLKADSDTITDNEAKWRVLNKITLGYLTNDIDTAWLYIQKMNSMDRLTERQRLLNTKYRAIYFIRKSRFTEAEQIIQNIDTAGFSPKMITDYLYLVNSYYRAKEEDGVDSLTRAKYERHILDNYLILDRMGGHSREISSFIKGNILAIQGRTEEAVDTLIRSYGISSTNHQKSYCSYEIAKQYLRLGNREKYEYWLAEGTINDFKVPVKAYLALFDLTLALLEDQQNERASKYVKTISEDATMLNYPLRISRSSKMQSLIFGATEYMYKRQQQRTLTITMVLSLLLTIIVVLMVVEIIQRRKLHKAYDTIYELSTIKDSFLFNYMVLAVEYLGRVEDYRHDLRVTYKSEGTAALVDMIRKPMSDKQEYYRFFKTFDETFLGIIPDFVEKVNALLLPEARLELNQDNTMPTELRLLAVIRLGFSTSNQIAKFLNCSINTVYSYRYNLRHSSLVDPDLFEMNIKKIS